MRLWAILIAVGTALAGADTPVRIYDLTAEVTKPELVKVTRPAMTAEAKAARVEGRVRLSLVVDDLGQPRDLEVTEGLGYGLDETAVKAVSQWRFRPAMKDGRAVWVRLRMSVKFVRDAAD